MGKNKKQRFIEAFSIAKKIIDLHVLYQRVRATPAIEIKKRKMEEIKKEIDVIGKGKKKGVEIFPEIQQAAKNAFKRIFPEGTEEIKKGGRYE